MRLLLLPTRRKSTRWLAFRLSLMKSDGGPSTLKTTKSRSPSLLISPNAVPRRDWRGPAFNTRLFRQHLSKACPWTFRKSCRGSRNFTFTGQLVHSDEKLPFAIRMSGHPSLSKSPNPVPHFTGASVSRASPDCSAVSKCKLLVFVEANGLPAVARRDQIQRPSRLKSPKSPAMLPKISPFGSKSRSRDYALLFERAIAQIVVEVVSGHHHWRQTDPAIHRCHSPPKPLPCHAASPDC